MKISVFGLGYVGAVSAGCFCKLGHEVIGVDVLDVKRDKIAAGESPVIEPELDELVATAAKEGKLTATGDVAEAIRNSDVSLVCVGTPSRRDGSLNLDYVQRVCEQIGAALKDHDGYHVVTIRSTIPAAKDALERSSTPAKRPTSAASTPTTSATRCA